MFGGQSPEKLLDTFVEHRDNVSHFLQSYPACPTWDHDDRPGDAADSGAGPMSNQSVGSHEHASDDSEQYAPALGTTHRNDDEDHVHGQWNACDGESSESLAPSTAQEHCSAFTAAPLQLASTSELCGHHGRMRVEIPTAHRCGDNMCLCETHCLAVHEVEPALPHG